MTDSEVIVGALLQAVERIDSILVSWGFQFELMEEGSSSAGRFANGHYRRGSTRICLIFRASQGLGCIGYEQETTTDLGPLLPEQIVYGISHQNLMQRLGHADDCRLLEKGINSAARVGGDTVDALVHDLRHYAAPVLSTETAEFIEIIRFGHSRRQVLPRN